MRWITVDPKEISKELVNYSFFRGFGEEFLQHLSPFFQLVEYNPQESILTQGQENQKLFILRSGTVEISLDGEHLTLLNTPGEIFGEMSVLRSRPVSTTVKAMDLVQMYELESDSLNNLSPHQREHFYYIIYKLHLFVLMERLEKTNNKAKNFEIAARELQRAKQDLESITSAKIKFLSREIENSHHAHRILLLDPLRKNQNIAKMALIGTGVQLSICDSYEMAKPLLEQENFDLIFCDIQWVNNLLSEHRNLREKTVFLCGLKCPLEYYDPLVQTCYLISRDPEQREFSIRSYLTALYKILNQDYFGLEKHLAMGVEIREFLVQSSRQKDELLNQVQSYFESFGLRKNLLDRALLVTGEFLMNAVYDAPTDPETGKALYNHLPRGVHVELPPHLHAKLRFGCDGIYAGISIIDPNGSLQQETLLKYLRSSYENQGENLNSSLNKGGGGLGLHQIVESSDSTIFNVQSGVCTEVISIWKIENLLDKTDWTPTFNFFFTSDS